MTTRIGSGATPPTTTTTVARPATSQSPAKANAANSTATAEPGWVGKQPAARSARQPGSPNALAAGVVNSMTSTSAVSGPVAKAISPTDVLKLVKNGDVDVNVPLRGGELIPGKLSAKPNTSMRMTLRVKNGEIDFANSKLKFDPPLSGPLGVGLEGVNLTKDGRMEVEASWLPNPVVGRATSSKLPQFVESITSGQSMPVSLLGITVANVPMSDGGASGSAPIEPGALAQKVDVQAASISVQNVQFLDSTVPLGAAGSIRLGNDAKVELKGSLTDLQLKGRVSVQDLNLDLDGTSLKSGKGSADLEVRWNTDTQLNGKLEGSIKNLSVQAESAVSKRENGDFLELARGKIENGSLSFTQEVTGGRPTGKPQTSLELGSFNGTIAKGQITVPDGNGTAQIILGKTAVSGRVEVTPQRVFVSGDVDLNANVEGLDTQGNVQLSVSKLALTGKAKFQYDSNTGMKAEGNLRTQASLTGGTIAQGGNDVRLKGGSLDVTTKKFELDGGGNLSVEGRANNLDLGFENLSAGEKGMSVRGGAGSIKGKGDVSLSNKTLTFDKGDLNISASLEDGKLALGDNLDLDIKAGTRMEAVVQQVVFGGGASTKLDLSKAKVEAALDGGTVRLPTGQALEFKEGTKLALKLDRLHLPGSPEGIPEAQGSIELQARLSAGELDLSKTSLPGVSFSHAEGVDQVFKMRMGRFTVEKNGAFDLQDLSFGVEANVRRLGGTLR